jgi:hypothetical protein
LRERHAEAEGVADPVKTSVKKYRRGGRKGLDIE